MDAIGSSFAVTADPPGGVLGLVTGVEGDERSSSRIPCGGRSARRKSGRTVDGTGPTHSRLLVQDLDAGRRALWGRLDAERLDEPSMRRVRTPSATTAISTSSGTRDRSRRAGLSRLNCRKWPVPVFARRRLLRPQLSSGLDAWAPYVTKPTA